MRFRGAIGPSSTEAQILEAYIAVALEHGEVLGKAGHRRINRLRSLGGVIARRVWEMGDHARSALWQLLEHRNPDVRLFAALTLLARDVRRVEPVLSEFEREPPGPRRAAAYGALLAVRLGVLGEVPDE